MSIQSMTGFSKVEHENENYTVNIEIKSVNHRFKDIRFKMGNIFNPIENTMRKELEKRFSRGSFDIYINYKKSDNLQKKVEIDYIKVKQFLSEFQEKTNQPNLSVNPCDFLRSDFLLEDESKEEVLNELTQKALVGALDKLASNREEEGSALIKVMQKHKEQYTNQLKFIHENKKNYQDKVKEKMQERFNKDGNGLVLDEGRFGQEVIYYLEKLDIDEELNRIDIHLNKLEQILGGDGEVGRQIDFLIQELNRETNTIGSKSGEGKISEAVVQMKVQLEKMREQGLNLQ